MGGGGALVVGVGPRADRVDPLDPEEDDRTAFVGVLCVSLSSFFELLDLALPMVRGIMEPGVDDFLEAFFSRLVLLLEEASSFLDLLETEGA